PDGYRRNQGVGSWEINLAAFLTDLNSTPPNPPQVGGYGGAYFYDQGTNNGAAFFDAKQLLSFRYAENAANLSVVGAMFPPTGFTNQITLINDGIDASLQAPVMPFGSPLNFELD